MLVTAALVGVLAAVAARAASGVRRRSPFVVACGDPWQALARVALVADGTEICVIAPDLRDAASPSGRAVLRKWLSLGARIRCVVRVADEAGLAVVRQLAREETTGVIQLMAVEEERLGEDLAQDVLLHRFVILNCPDQLWLEGAPGGEYGPRHCEYVPGASGDERWEDRARDFRTLASWSSTVDLGG
jgi:hypothetical protein